MTKETLRDVEKAERRIVSFSASSVDSSSDPDKKKTELEKELTQEIHPIR